MKTKENRSIVDPTMVLETILIRRLGSTRQRVLCLYRNLMINDFSLLLDIRQMFVYPEGCSCGCAGKRLAAYLIFHIYICLTWRRGSQLSHNKRDMPEFYTVLLHSNLGSPRRNYLSIITTDTNVLHFGSIASKRLLKIRHLWPKNKERKVDFRFVERKCLVAINLTGSAEGALVPVFLRITHWTKSRLPVSPPGLFLPWTMPCVMRRKCAH